MERNTPEIVMLMNLKGPFVNPRDSYIHHFTSQDNLVKILRSGQLWMTRFDRMCNDHKEGDYILELYNEALDELLENGTIDRLFYETVRNPSLNHKRVILDMNGIRVPCVPYVTCFSRNYNDEYMRDYYVGGKGGWIRFTSKISRFGKDGGLPNNYFDNCMLLGFCPMEYDRTNVIEDLKKMIIDFRNSYYDNLNCIREYIGECLSAHSLAVKSPEDDNGKSTIEENEIRLIYFIPEDKSILKNIREKMSRFEVVDDIHIAIPGIFDRDRNAETPIVFSSDEGVLRQIQSECPERICHFTKEKNSHYGETCCLILSTVDNCDS